MDFANNRKDAFPLTLEQQKLLASAIRIQILHTIAETPRTAKQVADLLGQSPGNIHYHIKRLEEGGLVTLVETREVGGIVEKYYKSHHTRFRASGFSDYPGRARLFTRLLLSENDQIQLLEELEQVLLKWESRLPEQKGETLQEVDVLIRLQPVQTEEGEE
jgi:DNA-binding transcriptional ArsR family regulator